MALFAFNRPSHLSCTLDALAANELASDSPLTIFCDGPRTDIEKIKTNAVRRVAKAEATKGRFASVRIQFFDFNRGLAPSLIAGITAMLEESERIIVLEDDLLTSPYFLRYMNDGLTAYANNPKVASIHGYMYPHVAPPSQDTFFLRGADCWGWATWRRAWAIFNANAFDLLQKIRQAQEEDAFNRYGACDYMGMLQAASEGRVSSWAVRWLASAWLADMYTLYPAASLVQQIGFDASGTHCGVSENCHVPFATRPITVMQIPVVEDQCKAVEFAAWLKGLSSPSASSKTRLHAILRKCSNLHAFLHCSKKAFKDCLPPIAIRGLKKLLHTTSSSSAANIWQGDYPDWKSAVSACDGGYDSDAIFQKVVAAARKVRDGEALWERDSVCFYHEEYNWHLLACLMMVAAQNKGNLHVLDFGGAFGSTYQQNKKILDKLPSVSWNVVEQGRIVLTGQEEFTTKTLHFFSSIAECFQLKPINVILFSGVLQYLPEPYALIQEVVKHRIDNLIIDRTPFLKSSEKFTIQHVASSIYAAHYPHRWLNREHVASLLGEQYDCLPDYESPNDPPSFYGFISTRRTSL